MQPLLISTSFSVRDKVFSLATRFASTLTSLMSFTMTATLSFCSIEGCGSTTVLPAPKKPKYSWKFRVSHHVLSIQACRIGVFHIVDMQANQRRSGRIFGKEEGFRRRPPPIHGRPIRLRSPTNYGNPHFGVGLHGTKNGQSGYHKKDEVNSSPPCGGAAAARARTRLRHKQEGRGQAVNHAQKTSCRSDRIRFEEKDAMEMEWGAKLA